LFVKNKLSVITTFLCIFSLFFITFTLQEIHAQELEGGEQPLAVINGETITLKYFENFWDMIPDDYKSQLNKEDILEQLITQTLLIQKANELNLSEDPEISFQIKNTVDQILIQSLLEKEIINKISLTDNDIEIYYEENKENYWQEEEIHALDILVETEEEAGDIAKKIEEGEDFSLLAKEYSIATSASAGGDIGFISKGTLRSEIEDHLFILNPGEISEIIPVENGFHIFKVLEKNPSGYLELDEIKEEIEYQLLPTKQQEAFNAYLKEIEDNSIIEKNTDMLLDESGAVAE